MMAILVSQATYSRYLAGSIDPSSGSRLVSATSSHDGGWRGDLNFFSFRLTKQLFPRNQWTNCHNR